MTDLQGAVGIAQFCKLPSIVRRRRDTAAALISALRRLRGIRLVSLREGESSSWWTFPVWIDRSVLKNTVTPADFQKALAAEGVPCQVGFMPRTLLDYMFMRERRTYGRSQYPWACPHARSGIEYREEEYPNSRLAVTEPIAIPWNEGIGADDVQDVAEALEKICAAFSR